MDVAADFIVVFRPYSYISQNQLKMWLESPQGKVITPGDASSLGNVSFVQKWSFALFRCKFPIFADHPDSHIGRWRLWIEYLEFTPTGDDAPTPTSGPVYFSVMCKARSDLVLKGRLIQSGYEPGSIMTVILEPLVYGIPVNSLGNTLKGQIVRPDNSKREITLNRGEYGEYKGQFTDTYSRGPYLFSTEISVQTPRGNRITRFRQLTGLILESNRSDNKEIIRLLRELIEKCCNRSLTMYPDLVPVMPYQSKDQSVSQYGFCSRRSQGGYFDKIEVIVKNIGQSAAPESSTRAEFYLSNRNTVSITKHTSALNPGEETVVEFDIPPGCYSSGVSGCRFKITVDALNEIMESNEENNSIISLCPGAAG